jgi:cytochrome c oxidase subunit 1
MGAAQMLTQRVAAPAERPETYYFVTAHGTPLAYAADAIHMGFGYFVATTALDRPLPSIKAAWAGFWMAAVGVVMATIPILLGKATVLYTFYPPLTGSAFYYLGLVLVVVGSWVWAALMIIAMRDWKRANAGRPVPLAMFATVANAVLWLWTTIGVAAELLFQVFQQRSGGHKRSIHRAYPFSWIYAIVYFWLIPAWIAFIRCCRKPQAGALQRHHGRLSFFLPEFTVPVGMHHCPRIRTRLGLQVPADDADRARHGADTPHDIHDHRLARDCWEVARRYRPLRLDHQAPVGAADGARERTWVRHAGVGRHGRPHQHVVQHERDGSQHNVGHRALPSDLRRFSRHHVFRDCL